MNDERKLALALAIFALLSVLLSFGTYQLRQKVDALEKELEKVEKVNVWCEQETFQERTEVGTVKAAKRHGWKVKGKSATCRTCSERGHPPDWVEGEEEKP